MAKSILLLGSLLLLVSSACAFSHNPAVRIYAHCSADKYSPNTTYAQNLDQVLASINNSAPYHPYNNFTIRTNPDNPQEVIAALYQCRGDISRPDCTECVQEAVSELRMLCFQYFSGSIQMEGCSVKYENYTFLGQQGIDLELRKCGPRPRIKNDDHLRLQRDEVLDGLMNQGQSYRVSNSKFSIIESIAQCSVDLSPDQCQDCVSEAIQVTKRECYTEFAYGDIFLNKCYVRYTINQDVWIIILIVLLAMLSAILAVSFLTEMAYHKWESIKGNGKISPSNIELQCATR